MSDVSTRSRVPQGVREGGRFAAEPRSESDVVLPVARRPREISWGSYDVADTVVGGPDPVDPRRSVLYRAGRPDLRARFEAAALRMELSEQQDVIENQLHALMHKKVTLLLADGTGSVQAWEGTLCLDQAAQLILRCKGSQNKGVVLRHVAVPYGQRRRDPRILGVTAGYGGQDRLTATFDEHLSKVPELQMASLDGIPLDDGAEHPEVAAVFMFRHAGFGEETDGRGSLFFATDITPGDDDDVDGTPVNGYAIFRPGSGLISEHGSMYFGDLKTGGRVKDFTPGAMTFRDAVKLARYVEDAEDVQLAWEMLAGRLDPRFELS